MRILAIILGLLAVTSCSSGGAASVFYVVTGQRNGDEFFKAMEEIANEERFDVMEDRAPSGSGSVFRVLEGRGHGLKLWVQSVTLSGNEDPKLCGLHSGSHPDPLQFVVFVEARFLGSREEAVKLGERIKVRLLRSGFDVRLESPICGAAPRSGGV